MKPEEGSDWANNLAFKVEENIVVVVGVIISSKK